jgi:O-antigen ligase
MILRRGLVLAPALLLAPLLVVGWYGDGITPLLRVTALVFLAVTALSPAAGLLLMAGVMPVATQLQVAARAPMSGAQVAELMVLAFLVVVSVRRAIAADFTPSRLVRPGIVMGAVMVSAGLVQLGVDQQATAATPAAFFSHLHEHLGRKYFSDFSAFPALHVSMAWLEALLLAVAVERLIHQQPPLRVSATRMFLVGATAAASCAAIRLFEISARTGAFWASVVQYVRSLRINPHYGDLNAGGSYYLLSWVPAVWLGFKRQFWPAAMSFVILLGLWLTGSRAAMISGVLALGAAWVTSRRPRLVLMIAGGLVVAVVALVLTRQREEKQNAVALGMHLRGELITIGVKIAAISPVFGVGPGQFRVAAAPFVTPALAAQLGPEVGIENAHNQFIQILAELGAVGLIVFIWVLAAPARAIAGSIARRTAPPALQAMAWGLVAFLVSSMLGHPLLTTQVLFAFFLALGITAGLIEEPAPVASARVKWLVGAAVVALFASIPFRIDAARRAAVLDNVTIGVSSVRGTIDDVRYRVPEPHAVWFVDATTKQVTLPLRQAPEGQPACRVGVTVDGQPFTEVTPSSAAWLRLDVPLPPPGRSRASRRIGVDVLADGCRLLVGPLVKH